MHAIKEGQNRRRHCREIRAKRKNDRRLRLSCLHRTIFQSVVQSKCQCNSIKSNSSSIDLSVALPFSYSVNMDTSSFLKIKKWSSIVSKAEQTLQDFENISDMSNTNDSLLSTGTMGKGPYKQPHLPKRGTEECMLTDAFHLGLEIKHLMKDLRFTQKMLLRGKQHISTILATCKVDGNIKSLNKDDEYSDHLKCAEKNISGRRKEVSILLKKFRLRASHAYERTKHNDISSCGGYHFQRIHCQSQERRHDEDQNHASKYFRSLSVKTITSSVVLQGSISIIKMLRSAQNNPITSKERGKQTKQRGTNT